jgi:hypothetical protein
MRQILGLLRLSHAYVTSVLYANRDICRLRQTDLTNERLWRNVPMACSVSGTCRQGTVASVADLLDMYRMGAEDGMRL